MNRHSARTFYRIVLDNPPTDYDFTSAKERGESLFDPSKADMWTGVSVYAKLSDAREKARTYPDKGQWIAELRVVEGPGVRIAKTGRRRDSHHTIWAAPSYLRQCVTTAHPVDEAKR